MKSSMTGELRELIASLSDGTLSEKEALRLNEILKTDPISQDQYLDHLLIDGLLEREFSGGSSADENRKNVEGLIGSRKVPILADRFSRLISGHRILVSVVACVLFIVGGFFWALSLEPQRQPIQIVDPGFEHGALVDPGAAKNAWHGDVVDVVERYSDVVPLEGNRMLRFVKSTIEPDRGCEIYQVIDLGKAAGAIARHSGFVDASAFFNAIDQESKEGDFAFGITVFAFSANPFVQPQAGSILTGDASTFGGSQIHADTDAASWQRVTTRLAVPAGTKYLMVQLAVTRTTEDEDELDDEFPGQFADKVTVNLVSSR